MTKHKVKQKRNFPKVEILEPNTNSVDNAVLENEDVIYEEIICKNSLKYKKYLFFVWIQLCILAIAFIINFLYIENIQEWYQEMGLAYTLLMVFNTMFFLMGAFTALTFNLEKRIFKKEISEMTVSEIANFTGLTVKKFKLATILLFFLLTNRFVPLIYATPITNYFSELIIAIIPVSIEITKWIFSVISWFFANIGFNIVASFIFQLYWERYGKHKFSGIAKNPKNKSIE